MTQIAQIRRATQITQIWQMNRCFFSRAQRQWPLERERCSGGGKGARERRRNKRQRGSPAQDVPAASHCGLFVSYWLDAEPLINLLYYGRRRRLRGAGEHKNERKTRYRCRGNGSALRLRGTFA